MIFALIFLASALLMIFFGAFQFTRGNRRNPLTWYYAILCLVMALPTFNNALQYYISASEGTEIVRSSYYNSPLGSALSLSQFLLFSVIFGFIRSLAKDKSGFRRILQRVLTISNIVFFVLGTAILLFLQSGLLDLPDISVYELLMPVAYPLVFFSIATLLYFFWSWIRHASLKRDRFQATVLAIVLAFSIFLLLTESFISEPNPILMVMSVISQLILIIICNHYAHRYNSFSFNAANLSKYVYTSVDLPVLILDETGDIMMCNAAAEVFFQRETEKLYEYTLFDLFDMDDGFKSIHYSKDNNTVKSVDARCRVAGQKCQISLNYVYDEFDEVICVVVIVTDVTEKEELIRQLNESHAKIAQYSQQLEAEVESQTDSILSLQEAVVYSMGDLVNKKDGYTGEHTHRVGDYVAILLRELARQGYPFSESDIQMAVKSSLLHDIGKISIPDSILQKNGKLTDSEYAIMKSHSISGADSLEKSMRAAKDNTFLQNAFLMAKYHHEKWCGGGYPEGRKGEEIPLIARVIAIADVYDALRSRRPYKEPFSREKARSIILEEKGKHFDPSLVDIFLSVEDEFDAVCESNDKEEAQTVS